MNTALFQKFCDIAYTKAGIRLRDGKQALVAARVAKRLRALGLTEPGEYLQVLENDASGTEVASFLDVISTNFTAFYREPSHFERLSEFISERIKSGRKRIRLWCAASSTGEEPYTLAITCAEAIGNASVDWRILATDISRKVIAIAERGIYEEPALKDVPRSLRTKYFTSVRIADETWPHWQVHARLRSRVVFRRLNLANPPYPMPGPIDVVFCRNVMIYFDSPVRQRLVSEIERLLAEDALVCIGHSESLNGLETNLLAIEPSVYQPRSARHLLKASKPTRKSQG